MRIAPLAAVKASSSVYLDECGSEGPVVITRNGKAAAVLLVPYDDDDLERNEHKNERPGQRKATEPSAEADRRALRVELQLPPNYAAVAGRRSRWTC